jgi:hypothetical protein
MPNYSKFKMTVSGGHIPRESELQRGRVRNLTRVEVLHLLRSLKTWRNLGRVTITKQAVRR